MPTGAAGPRVQVPGQPGGSSLGRPAPHTPSPGPGLEMQPRPAWWPGTGLGQRVWARLHPGPGLTAPRPTPPWVRTAGEWAASLRPDLGRPHQHVPALITGRSQPPRQPLPLSPPAPEPAPDPTPSENTATTLEGAGEARRCVSVSPPCLGDSEARKVDSGLRSLQGSWPLPRPAPWPPGVSL